MKGIKAIGLAVMMLGCALAAVAQTRTIDFTQPIRSLDGTVISQPATDPKAKAEPLTLGDVAVNVLEQMGADDQKLTGEEKFRMDILARKIYRQKAAALTSEEIAMIKARIGKFYGPSVIGSAWHLLDPNQ